MKMPEVNIQKTVALIVVVGFIVLIFMWMWFPPRGDANALAVLNTLTGALAAAFTLVLNYNFGSTSTGEKQADTVNKVALGTTANGHTEPPKTPTV